MKRRENRVIMKSALFFKFQNTFRQNDVSKYNYKKGKANINTFLAATKILYRNLQIDNCQSRNEPKISCRRKCNSLKFRRSKLLIRSYTNIAVCFDRDYSYRTYFYTSPHADTPGLN